MQAELNLRPYQRTGYQYIINHPRCYIAARMGMGKTLATLLTIADLILLGEVRRVLILAPRRVALSVWAQEVERWGFDLRVSVITDPSPAKRVEALHADAQIYVANYDILPWMLKEKDFDYDMVVADETTRLKSFRLRGGSKRAQALGKVAFKAKRWVGLAGTPAPNKLLDLWGQMWFIDQGQRLGRTYKAYQDRWFKELYPGAHEFVAKPGAQNEIMERISDVFISFRPEDYFSLDDPVRATIYVDLPLSARITYAQLEKTMRVRLQEAGSTVTSLSAATLSLKCLQIANGAVYTDEGEGAWELIHDEKIDALGELVEDLAEPVIVAYHFKSDLARLKKAFPQGCELKDAATEAAWNRGEVPLLFLHPASAGHGLNLQHGGRTIVFFGQWWDLEHYEQIIERIGPMRQFQAGLKRVVQIYHIIARDTVDELVMERRVSKKAVQDLLMERLRG